MAIDVIAKKILSAKHSIVNVAVPLQNNAIITGKL
jgi:hypothetical protein